MQEKKKIISMIKLGIIGHPIGHTMSPLMHKAALEAMYMEGSYEAFDTPPDELFDRIKFFKKEGFKGFNVTVPLKVKTAFLLDDFDEHADLAGAVNTVLIRDDKRLIGYNTDIYGFKRAIPPVAKKNIKNKKAVIIGNGGAARAAAIGLIELGVEEIIFCVRNLENAQDLKKFFDGRFKNLKISLKEISDTLNFKDVAIIVNTTPVGMDGVDNHSPISEKVISTLSSDAVLYDLVYKPKNTEFIKLGKKYNLKTISGMGMLVHQGAKAFEIWTGKKAPVRIMKKIVQDSL